MANVEESSPLLGKEEAVTNEKEMQSTTTTDGKPNSPPSVEAVEVAEPVKKQQQQPEAAGAAVTTVPMGWTAQGLPMPVAPETAMGEPMMRRAMWDSSICACLGRHDEFCSSDLEVCLLGSIAPCVLYASNAERLDESGPGTFANHCLPYSGLYVLGNTLFGWNCMAPWFSYPTRTAMRRKFNLEGSCEALTKSCACYGSFWEDEVQREQYESACDLTTHIFCHPCALCQEGRELRRRLPHPGFNAQPIMVMIPPSEQAMGREA